MPVVLMDTTICRDLRALSDTCLNSRMSEIGIVMLPGSKAVGTLPAISSIFEHFHQMPEAQFDDVMAGERFVR